MKSDNNQDLSILASQEYKALIVSIYKHAAQCAFSNKNLQLTADHLSKALEYDPENKNYKGWVESLSFQLGMKLHLSRQYEGAIKSFENALKYNPSNEFYKMHLGAVNYLLGGEYAKAQNFKMAIEFCTKAVECAESNERVMKPLATEYALLACAAFQENGDTNAAMDCFFKSIGYINNERFKYNFTTEFAKRAILALKNKSANENALDCVLKALEYSSPKVLFKGNLAATYCKLGLQYQKSKNYNEVIECFTKAVVYDPTIMKYIKYSKCIAEAHHALGVKVARDGKFTEAMVFLEEAVDYDRLESNYKKSLANVHNSLASAMSITRKYKEAIEHYKKSMRYDASDARYKKSLGIVYHNEGVELMNSGKYAEANESLLHALECDGTSLAYKAKLAKIYAIREGIEFRENHNYKAALDYVFKAIELESEVVRHQENASIIFKAMPKENCDALDLISKLTTLLKDGDKVGHLTYMLISLIAQQKTDATIPLQQFVLKPSLFLNSFRGDDITIEHVKVIDTILKASTSISALFIGKTIKLQPEAMSYIKANLHLWKSLIILEIEPHLIKESEVNFAECSHLMRIPGCREFEPSDKMDALVQDVMSDKRVAIIATYDIETLRQACQLDRLLCFAQYQNKAEVASYMKNIVFKVAVSHLVINSEHSPCYWLPEDVCGLLLEKFYTINELCVMAKGFASL